MSKHLKRLNWLKSLILFLPSIVIFIFILEDYVSTIAKHRHVNILSVFTMPTIMIATISLWWRATKKRFLAGENVCTWRFICKSQVQIMLLTSLLHSICTTGIFFFIYFLIPFANTCFYLLFISTWWSPLLYYVILPSLSKIQEDEYEV